MSDNEKRIDQIIREMDQIDIEEMKSEANSFIGKAKTAMNPFHYFWIQVSSSALLIWNNYLKPVWNFVYWLGFGLLWKHYRKIWDRFSFEEKDGERVFSRKRGAVVLATTAFMLYFVVSMLSIAWHTTLYFATARVDEVVYLSNAQEIIPEENIFSVQGCEITQAPGEAFSCSADQSLYFRIEPTTFAQVWSLVNTGSFFYPDYVSAPIAPGWQRCTITSYGFRLKTLIRRFEIYPELLAARCEPITG
jgi:hypothetical protein